MIESSGIDLPRRPFKGDHPELTEEQKAILDQARELMQSGDRESARELLQANDISLPPFHREHGRGEDTEE